MERKENEQIVGYNIVISTRVHMTKMSTIRNIPLNSPFLGTWDKKTMEEKNIKKLFCVHIPSILHRALVGVGSLRPLILGRLHLKSLILVLQPRQGLVRFRADSPLWPGSGDFMLLFTPKAPHKAHLRLLGCYAREGIAVQALCPRHWALPLQQCLCLYLGPIQMGSRVRIPGNQFGLIRSKLNP